MGQNYSNSKIESMTKVTNNILSKVSQSFENSAESRNWQQNMIQIDLSDARVRGCGLNVSQRSTVAVQAMVNATTQISNEMATELKNSIEKEISNSIEQVNKGLNLGQSNVANMTTRTMSEINNKVQSIIETSIKNSVKVDTENSNVIIFKAPRATFECRPGEKLEFSQEAITKSVAANISSSMIENIMKTTAINELKEKVSNSIKQKNEGLDTAMLLLSLLPLLIIGFIIYQAKSAGVSLLTNKYFIGFVIVLIVLCIIGFIYTSSQKSEVNEYN